MKLRKLAKKLLSVLLVFALFVNLTLSTFAAASDDSDGLKPLSEITVEELETAALNVAAMFAPDEEVDVGEIIPMYDASDTLIGFSVSYTQEEEPCGYVILDFRNEFPVADVCIGAEVTSPYYTCETTTATEVSMDVPLEPTLETEKRIYSVGSAQYSTTAAGIQLGTTTKNNIASGMKKYVEAMGYTISTSTKSSPSFSYLQVVATSNISGTFSYGIYLPDSDSSTGYSRHGHTVNLVGYTYIISESSYYEYLNVIDGWDTGCIRYIDYNNTDFVDTYAVRYTIS